jgi:hypothetical protein
MLPFSPPHFTDENTEAQRVLTFREWMSQAGLGLSAGALCGLSPGWDQVLLHIALFLRPGGQSLGPCA